MKSIKLRRKPKTYAVFMTVFDKSGHVPSMREGQRKHNKSKCEPASCAVYEQFHVGAKQRRSAINQVPREWTPSKKHVSLTVLDAMQRQDLLLRHPYGFNSVRVSCALISVGFRGAYSSRGKQTLNAAEVCVSGTVAKRDRTWMGTSEVDRLMFAKSFRMDSGYECQWRFNELGMHRKVTR